MPGPRMRISVCRSIHEFCVWFENRGLSPVLNDYPTTALDHQEDDGRPNASRQEARAGVTVASLQTFET